MTKQQTFRRTQTCGPITGFTGDLCLSFGSLVLVSSSLSKPLHLNARQADLNKLVTYMNDFGNTIT